MAKKLSIPELVENWMSKVPDELKPVVAKYGPILVTWTIQEVWDWIELLQQDHVAAYRQILASMKKDGAAILAQFDAKIEELSGLNVKTSARVAVGREAMGAILGGVLRILLIRFGF